MDTFVAESPVVAEKALLTCPACKNTCAGPLCNNCGEDVHPKRITVKTLLASIPDVFFDLESGLFYTIKTMFKRPGAEVKEYFAGDRARHIKPLKFILITGGLYAFLWLKFDITGTAGERTEYEKFADEITSVLLLLQFPFIAMFTWLCFYKRKYTFGEHLVANAYFIGEVILYNVVLFPIYYLANHTSIVSTLQVFYILFILAYYTYAFYGWFYNSKSTRGLLICGAFVFGLILFIALLTEILIPLLWAIMK